MDSRPKMPAENRAKMKEKMSLHKLNPLPQPVQVLKRKLESAQYRMNKQEFLQAWVVGGIDAEDILNAPFTRNELEALLDVYPRWMSSTGTLTEYSPDKIDSAFRTQEKRKRKAEEKSFKQRDPAEAKEILEAFNIQDGG